MRNLGHLVAIAITLGGTFGAADAGPRDRDEVDDADEADDADAARHRRIRNRRKAARLERARARKRHRAERARDDGRVAFDARDEAGDDERDAPVKLRKRGSGPQDWTVAIGPYLWASSVDADVSIGPANVSTGIDFMQLNRHARYGAEVVAEVRYRRFSIAADLMYGVVDVSGTRAVGPLMVSLDGSASSLLIDGVAGYQLVGTDRSTLSLEARAGVRYQRTAISAKVGVAGTAVEPPESVAAGSDALAGGRVVVRPYQRLSFSGSGDIGLFGASTSTWSASAEASVRATSRILVSLGYRTMLMDRSSIAITMHGPKLTLQLTF